jgi:hypothetical protein
LLNSTSVTAAPGIFANPASPTENLIFQAAPVGIDVLTPGLAGQFGLDAWPDALGTLEANGLTWSIYNTVIQGLTAQIGLAEQDGTTYLVIMLGPESGFDELVAQVFDPVLASVELTG